MSLAEILSSAARRFSDQTAIIDRDGSWSFGEVVRAVDRFAAVLRSANVGPGDRVALLVSNSPAFPVAYYAVLQIDAVVVPLNPLLSNPEIVTVLSHCTAPVLIAEECLVGRAREILDRLDNTRLQVISTTPINRPDPTDSSCPPRGNRKPTRGGNDIAVILYTSGSTGKPKGVELTHRNLISNAESVSREKFSRPCRRVVLGPGHVSLAVLPLSHAFGQTNLLNGTWFNGGAISLIRRFDPAEVLERMIRDRVTFFAGVPTMYFELLKYTEWQSVVQTNLHFCVCGGAALDARVKSEFRNRFGVTIQESYGLTECSPMVSCQRVDQAERAGTVGRPIRGIQVRIVNAAGHPVGVGEVGELQVRGRNVFAGYHADPHQTGRAFTDGWFRTGDLVSQESDGQLRVVDRLQEVINRGGYKIFPREIETVIAGINGVGQVAVVGVDDPKYGQEIAAFVVPEKQEKTVDSGDGREGDRCSSADSLIQTVLTRCRKKLAAYKIPRIIEIMNELPLGSTGKIDRQALRKINARRLESVRESG